MKYREFAPSDLPRPYMIIEEVAVGQRPSGSSAAGKIIAASRQMIQLQKKIKKKMWAARDKSVFELTSPLIHTGSAASLLAPPEKRDEENCVLAAVRVLVSEPPWPSARHEGFVRPHYSGGVRTAIWIGEIGLHFLSLSSEVTACLFVAICIVGAVRSTCIHPLTPHVSHGHLPLHKLPVRPISGWSVSQFLCLISHTETV